MKNFRNLSGNDLSETIHALNSAIYELDCKFLHISHFIQKDIDRLKKTREAAIKEKERREDQF